MDIEVPAGATAVAVLLHPHPDMGGNRFNHVIEALYRGLPAAGIGAVRFDFSSSDLDEAAADATAAIEAAAAAAPEARLVVVAYSFGAMVAMLLTDPRIAGWYLVALPVDHSPESTLPEDPRPKAIVVPELDFSPPGRVAEVTSSWSSTTMTVLPGADHFLAGATPGLVSDVVAWVRDLA